MSLYGRAARGAEAGVIAAVAIEFSFLVLDLIRLEPLATPLTLAGAVPTPSGLLVDLTTASGIVAVAWAGYQLMILTFLHLFTFGLVGVAAALIFDWREPVTVGRFATVAVLCVAAFFATVAMSSSVVVLESVGSHWVVGMNLMAAGVLGGALRLVSSYGAESDPE